MNESSQDKRDPEEGNLTRSTVLGGLLLAMTILGVWLCSRFALPFIPAIALAFTLRVVAGRPFAWLTGRMRRGWAAALTVLLVAGALVVPLAWVGRLLVVHALEGIQELSSQASHQRWESILGRHHWLEPVVRRLAGSDLGDALAQLLSEGGRSIPSVVAMGTVALGQVMIALFVLFYFLRDDQDILDGIRGMLPLTNREVDQLYGRIRETVWATVLGVVALAILKGILGGFAFWGLGIPAPMLWGTVMGFVSVVPILGPFVVWVPAAAFLMLEGNYAEAAILTAYGLVVLSLVDDVLYPLLVGEQMHMHTVLVLFSMLGGLAVIGSAGFVAGPVVVTITQHLLKVWRQRTRDGRPAEAALPS